MSSRSERPASDQAVRAVEICGPWGTQQEPVALCARPTLQHLMTTNLVDLDGHVGGKPLSVIDLAAMSKSHNHDQEHVIGNGVDDAVVAYAHPITRATS